MQEHACWDWLSARPLSGRPHSHTLTHAPRRTPSFCLCFLPFLKRQCREKQHLQPQQHRSRAFFSVQQPPVAHLLQFHPSLRALPTLLRFEHRVTSTFSIDSVRHAMTAAPPLPGCQRLVSCTSLSAFPSSRTTNVASKSSQWLTHSVSAETPYLEKI